MNMNETIERIRFGYCRICDQEHPIRVLEYDPVTETMPLSCGHVISLAGKHGFAMARLRPDGTLAVYVDDTDARRKLAAEAGNGPCR